MTRPQRAPRPGQMRTIVEPPPERHRQIQVRGPAAESRFMDRAAGALSVSAQASLRGAKGGPLAGLRFRDRPVSKAAQVTLTPKPYGRGFHSLALGRKLRSPQPRDLATGGSPARVNARERDRARRAIVLRSRRPG
jgi:hypothetical protein